MRHKMIASWPGPDPAIHVYRLPRGVDHRVKPGDDDLRVSGERRLAMRTLAPFPGERGGVRGRKKETPLIEYGL